MLRAHECAVDVVAAQSPTISQKLIRIKAVWVDSVQRFPERAKFPEAKMTRLMMILFSIISTTLMGVGIVIALTTGNDTLQPILIAAAIGFVLALPVSWLVAKQMA